jgi:hypothetical protein
MLFRVPLMIGVALTTSVFCRADWVVYGPSLKCDINGVTVANSGTPVVCLAMHSGTRYTDQFTSLAACTNCTNGGTGQPTAYVIVTVGVTKACGSIVSTAYYGGTITSGTNGVYAESQSKIGAGPWGYDLAMTANCTGERSITGGQPPGESYPC